jgi:hypothetical protein
VFLYNTAVTKVDTTVVTRTYNIAIAKYSVKRPQDEPPGAVAFENEAIPPSPGPNNRRGASRIKIGSELYRQKVINLANALNDEPTRLENGKLDPDQLDPDWMVSPETDLPVPWIRQMFGGERPSLSWSSRSMNVRSTEARPERPQVTREHIAHHLWQRVFQRFAVFDVLGFFFPRWLATPPSSRTPALACAACQG